MKNLLSAARALLLDFAATLFFVTLYALTGSILVSITAGVALALAQIGWRLARRNRVDALQWVSLVLVLGSGGATLLTHDPRFVMLKPSAIYVLVGLAMLERGWMLRYMPPIALKIMPDLVVRFGYVWAGLMFFSALLNLALALSLSVLQWGAFMSVYGIASKAGLFVLQYALMRVIGRSRVRSTKPGDAPALQRG